MKNILLASLIITISTFVVAQNVNIPDPNFKSCLVADLSINTNGDTEIQVSEANAFNGGIACDGLNISDLTGIEAFTAITWLECFANQLTSLDVSQNTALTYLWCNSNQLTSLDVSGAVALNVLKCNFNQLTNLDVSGVTTLTELTCFNNQITNLDLSQNSNLIELVCYTNQLTSLDVSQNTALNFLYCEYNQLSSLDVSQNVDLMGLSCSANQLTSLDVSQNTALTSLSCLDNQITNLDLSQNTALIGLYCENNQLNRLDLRNGNNNFISDLYSTNNPDLFCIDVDDTSYSIANWFNIDPWSSFSTNCSSAGIQESNTSNSFSIYPNPTIKTINLKVGESLIGSFYNIYDNIGKLMLNGKINSENTTIDLSTISQGIYFFRVGLNLEQTFKVVKE